MINNGFPLAHSLRNNCHLPCTHLPPETGRDGDARSSDGDAHDVDGQKREGKPLMKVVILIDLERWDQV